MSVGMYKGHFYKRARLCDMLHGCKLVQKWWFTGGSHYKTLKQLQAAIDLQEQRPMTATQVKTGEYKDFVARLEDGKYLTVEHYQHDEDRCRGQEDARRMLSHFKLIWGLESDPTQDGHSGGHASAVCRPVTAEYLHRWLPNVSGKLDSVIESAAEEWAHDLENEPPAFAENYNGNIVIYYNVPNHDEVARVLTDDELMQFWAWCIETEQFSQL